MKENLYIKLILTIICVQLFILIFKDNSHNDTGENTRNEKTAVIQTLSNQPAESYEKVVIVGWEDAMGLTNKIAYNPLPVKSR